MQCTDPPLKITNATDRLSRNFFWGSTESKKKLHLISRRKITNPKKEGGLGLLATEPKNKALQSSTGDFTKKVTPCGPVFLPKNTPVGEIQLEAFGVEYAPRPGQLWQGSMKFSSEAPNGWLVKIAARLFWFDKWLDKATIRSLVVGLLNRGEDELCIKDMVSPNGWN